jgi:hypothetical protein
MVIMKIYCSIIFLITNYKFNVKYYNLILVERPNFDVKIHDAVLPLLQDALNFLKSFAIRFEVFTFKAHIIEEEKSTEIALLSSITLKSS